MNHPINIFIFYFLFNSFRKKKSDIYLKRTKSINNFTLARNSLEMFRIFLFTMFGVVALKATVCKP